MMTRTMTALWLFIFRVITKRQNYLNGNGISHVDDIIYLVMEHPGQRSSIIFSTHERRERLKQAIIDFFAFAHDARYKNAIPAGKSGGSAFSEPIYITKNIISLQQRVCGYTRSPDKISKAYYNDMFNRGLLDPKY